MTDELTTRLRTTPIVPLIQEADPARAIATARALVDGGLTAIEVVLRTAEAIDCLKQVAKSIPEAVVGAGTVLSSNQVRSAADAGAAFIVSPGLDEDTVQAARNAGLPVFPGIATASELQKAWNLGIETVKFFPASLAGGTAMLKALGSVFRKVRFIPTGGISTSNLAEYLALPSVLACGGSWLTPATEIDAGNFAAVTRLAKEAIAIANDARKN